MFQERDKGGMCKTMEAFVLGVGCAWFGETVLKTGKERG